jgi:methylmalonyl-CoA/ethylmalonyl-CoA epimerase
VTRCIIGNLGGGKMQIEKIDRILVAVRDSGIASKFFSDLLGLKFDDIHVDEQEKVQYVRSPLGFELIQSTSPDGPVARFIEKRGEGLYTAIFKVADLEVAMEEMQKKGLRLVTDSRTGGLREAYFHPKDSHGIMIALCEYEVKHGATIAQLQD